MKAKLCVEYNRSGAAVAKPRGGTHPEIVNNRSASAMEYLDKRKAGEMRRARAEKCALAIGVFSKGRLVAKYPNYYDVQEIAEKHKGSKIKRINA